ncbi:MAG: hypothetical protein GXO55_02070 [Chloroflexi bacterium]|nr:hypothetical protein [Chloroflexota bacterium]
MHLGKPVRSKKREVLFLVILHLALSLLFSGTIPLGEAPDEADHWAYIQYLAREHHLPQGPELTQSKHPPLYHATAALWGMLWMPELGHLDSRLFLRANPDVTFSPKLAATRAYALNSFIHTTFEAWPWRDGPLAFHWVRLWSVLLSTWTVWATYRLARHAFPHEEEIPFLAAAVVALLPEFLFIGSVLNNDTLAALLASLALVMAMREYQTPGDRGHLLLGLVLGLGVWAKVSTLAVWPAVGLWLCLGALKVRGKGKGLLRCGLPFLVAGLLAAPWFLRNWRLFGDPWGWALARQTVDVRTGPWTWQDTWWLVRGWFYSFWGKFGSAGHIPMARPVYVLLLVATGLAGVGLIRRLQVDERSRAPLLGSGLALVGVMGAIWRYSLVALGTDQGRLLFPALAPIALLLAVGWLTLIPPSRRHWASRGLAGGLLILSLYAWAGVIRPAYAPPPPASLQRISPGDGVAFGPLRLLAWDLDGWPTLYWTLDEPTDVDWRVAFRLVDGEGHLVAEWKRSPGAGRWSTDHWPPGYIMQDVYPPQRWAHLPPGRYRVEVGVYPFMGSWTLPEGHTSPFVPLGIWEQGTHGGD